MTTGTEEQDSVDQNGGNDGNGGKGHPNVSPELQDAIRSIDAIGENAWGKDDDEDASRQGAAAEPNSQEEPDADQR
jgi:hypothetical protein